jgi:predicted HNH restriction endonuclease
MIPDNIEARHILLAIGAIKRNGVPKRRKSTKFDLLFDKKKLPPKLVISLANRYANGKEWTPDNFSGGHESNNFLVSRGFLIVDKKGRPVIVQPVSEDEAESFWEGRASYAKHRRLERDSKLGRLVKQRRLLKKGDLTCDACGFSFQKNYGARGSGYIEAHHTKPISELKGRVKTGVQDISLVCSNCHRILHRTRPWLSIAALQKILSTAR